MNLLADRIFSISSLMPLLVMTILLPWSGHSHGESAKGGAGRTVISDVPWDPERLTNDKVIYGADDRIDVYEETDALRLQLSDAVCSLMSRNSVTDNGDGTFTIQTSAYRISGMDPCEGEAFADQPTAAFCSGSLVGPDIIATAGHCYDQGDLSSVVFVFGFVMEDATTPVVIVNEDQVYEGVSVLGQALDSTDDYAIVRVDRDVTSPGAVPLEIRRSGTIPVDTQIGVIGHPSGLPQKIAFGDQTAVRTNSDTGHFVANLDTYGGNSGSAVFNAATGVVEGILVRGATDFQFPGGCFVSNQLTDGEGGEEVSKSTRFEQFVPLLPSGEGAVSLDRSTYSCTGVITITVRDTDLSGSVNVTVTSANGDTETVTLPETSVGTGRFEGSLPIDTEAVFAENGVLNAIDDVAITSTYNDASHGASGATVLTENAIVDCDGPPDTFTEIFGSEPYDLSNTTLIFTPDGSQDFYHQCATAATGFPTDPVGGASLVMLDDDSQLASLTGGKTVQLYGVSYSSFYVGSNGFITFAAADTAFQESTSSHFNVPRISAMFDDLDPDAGGTISWRQTDDRAVVTYQDISQFGEPDSNNFQVEMFFDGRIQITHLAVLGTDGLVGLSEGLGTPEDFQASDLSSNTDCNVAPMTDINSDNVVDASDIQFAVNAALGIDVLPFSGDVNGSGSVDAVDVQLVINAVLGLS